MGGRTRGEGEKHALKPKRKSTVVATPFGRICSANSGRGKKNTRRVYFHGTIRPRLGREVDLLYSPWPTTTYDDGLFVSSLSLSRNSHRNAVSVA